MKGRKNRISLLCVTLMMTQSLFAQTAVNSDVRKISLELTKSKIMYLPVVEVDEQAPADHSAERNSLPVPSPSNDNCNNAKALVVNASCTTGTTDGGNTQTNEVTLPTGTTLAFNQTVWYSFVATNTKMYVNTYVTAYTGSGLLWSPGSWTCAVYNGGGNPPNAASLISCKTSNSQGSADGVIVNILNGLTVGSTYLIQIGYRTGSGVGLIPTFCIKVGDQFSTDCNTCSTTCGPAYGFIAPPTVAQVTANAGYAKTPYLEGGITNTQCYTFFAINDSVDFGIIVSSTCGAANVSSLTWNLYATSNCGTVLQSGTLANLKLTGLTIGTSYTYCYTITIPTNCYHTQYWPYFVGASPLPVELLYFTARSTGKEIELNWATGTEINSDYFKIERSVDGINFETIETMTASHNSSTNRFYSYVDQSPEDGMNFYRLIEYDFDGQSKTYGPISARLKATKGFEFAIASFKKSDDLCLGFNNVTAGKKEVSIYDQLGKQIAATAIETDEGFNFVEIPTPSIKTGIYFITISDAFTSYSKRVVKF